MTRTALIAGTMMITFLTGLNIGCGAGVRSSESAHAAEETAFIQSERLVLMIHGMSCPLCASNVDGALMDVPGVRSVELDMGSGEATLRLDPEVSVSRKQLRDAVDRSGFSLISIEER